MNNALNLSKYNFHVAPGDVLLLKSSNKGLLNKAGQSIMRGRRSRYTHVAVVVDATTIVDAMPKFGVSFRCWRDIEADYDIEGSCVARHRQLSDHPKASERVYKNAMYFFRQPYKFLNILRTTKNISDQSGLVCSHFVVAFFERLNICVSDRISTRSLPVDIDIYTGSASEWRQFKLCESGIFSGARKPDISHPYWQTILGIAFQKARDELSKDAVKDCSREPNTKSKENNFLIPKNEKYDVLDGNNLLRQTKNMLANQKTIYNESNDLAFNLSRVLCAYEGVMLNLIEKLDNLHISEENIETIIQSQKLSDNMAQPITGANFWEQWKLLYQENNTHSMFLHEENTVHNRERHQDILDKSVMRAREMASGQIDSFNKLINIVKNIKTSNTTSVPAEMIVQIEDSIKSLQASGWFLQGEDLEVVSERIERIGDLMREMVSFGKKSEMEEWLIDRALKTAKEIHCYDLDTMQWLRVGEPGLRTFIEIIHLPN